MEHDPKIMIERSLKMPGAISVVVLLSILLPLFGIFPKPISLPLLMVFSIPTLYMFFAQVILNRPLSLKKNLLISGVASYVFYILSRYPFEAIEFYIYSLFFLIGGLISVIVYLVYYSMYLLGKKVRYENEEMSFRSRFIICFIPTLLVSLLFCVIISVFIGVWTFELAEVLS